MDERTREYSFRYSEDAKRPISLSLPLAEQRFSPAERANFRLESGPS